MNIRSNTDTDNGRSWRIAGASGRATRVDGVEAAGHAAWQMAHDDDAVQVRIEARR